MAISKQITFGVGDIIQCKGGTSFHDPQSLHVMRKITERRKTGYTWQHPDFPNAGDFQTENSGDPLLECGWVKVS